MIEFAFVMVINTAPEPLSDWKYIGNFNSCEQAQLYVSLHHPKTRESRCLLQEYISLPKGTPIRNIDMKNNSVRYINTYDMCKFRRDCTET